MCSALRISRRQKGGSTTRTSIWLLPLPHFLSLSWLWWGAYEEWERFNRDPRCQACPHSLSGLTSKNCPHVPAPFSSATLLAFPLFCHLLQVPGAPGYQLRTHGGQQPPPFACPPPPAPSQNCCWGLRDPTRQRLTNARRKLEEVGNSHGVKPVSITQFACCSIWLNRKKTHEPFELCER